MARKRNKLAKKTPKRPSLNWKILVCIFALLASCIVSMLFMNTGQQDTKEGVIWAILICGTHRLKDYRHEANVAHAYNILLRGGVHKDHIIVFMSDIAAYHVNTPWFGKLVNQAVDTQNDVENVRKNLVIDYSGLSCDPVVLLNAMRGRRTPFHNGKVLESGPNDRVFMYYSGHGHPGILGFPYGRLLFSSEVISALTEMKERSMYKEMVFYVDSCHSGFTFSKMPPHLNVFVMASASNKTKSFAKFCYYTRFLKSLELNFLSDQIDIENHWFLCLGTEMSGAWMRLSESVNRNNITLNDVFEFAKRKMEHSVPACHGDLSMGNKKLDLFLGNNENTLTLSNRYGYNISSLRKYENERGPVGLQLF